MSSEQIFMQQAITLAKEGVGQTGKNPSVAAILVHDDKIIAKARTANGGRPHAEEQVLKGNVPIGATLYVTLEPCSSNKNSCTNIIIDKKIKNVIIGCIDPNPNINGKSIDILQAHGINVKMSTLKSAAEDIICGFRKRILNGEPWITLKIAMSLDGKIALQNGKSKWITSEKQLQQAHMLRAKNDAIMVGIGTVLTDDPMLTCRHSDYPNKNLHRIIIDTHLKISPNSNIVKSSNEHPTTIFTAVTQQKRLGNCNVIEVDISKNNRLDIPNILQILGEMNINNLLVEGGREIFNSFYNSDLYDELAIFYGHKFLGNDAIPIIDNLHLKQLPNAIKKKICIY